MAITMEIRMTKDNGPCNGDRDGNDDGIFYFVYTIHKTLNFDGCHRTKPSKIEK